MWGRFSLPSVQCGSMIKLDHSSTVRPPSNHTLVWTEGFRRKANDCVSVEKIIGNLVTTLATPGEVVLQLRRYATCDFMPGACSDYGKSPTPSGDDDDDGCGIPIVVAWYLQPPPHNVFDSAFRLRLRGDFPSQAAVHKRSRWQRFGFGGGHKHTHTSTTHRFACAHDGYYNGFTFFILLTVAFRPHLPLVETINNFLLGAFLPSSGVRGNLQGECGVFFCSPSQSHEMRSKWFLNKCISFHSTPVMDPGGR